MEMQTELDVFKTAGGTGARESAIIVIVRMSQRLIRHLSEYISRTGGGARNIPPDSLPSQTADLHTSTGII